MWTLSPPSGWPYSKQPTRICGIPQIHNLLNPQILNFSKQGVQPSKSNVQGKTQDKYQLMIQWTPHAVYSIIKNLLCSSWHLPMARIFYTAKKHKKNHDWARRGLNSEGQLCLFSFDKNLCNRCALVTMYMRLTPTKSIKNYNFSFF